ncbi:MAG: hypothetical protein WKF94_09305 [Solirubrobacteraceae bacterium]
MTYGAVLRFPPSDAPTRAEQIAVAGQIFDRVRALYESMSR